jgi:hypothetical protein
MWMKWLLEAQFANPDNFADPAKCSSRFAANRFIYPPPDKP